MHSRFKFDEHAGGCFVFEASKTAIKCLNQDR